MLEVSLETKVSVSRKCFLRRTAFLQQYFSKSISKSHDDDSIAPWGI